MLKDFYIGDSFEYISVEYAKSGRSTCKTCKEKIGINELRVGLLVDDDHFSTGQGTQWFHQACFHFKPRHKLLQIDTLNKTIHNLDTLQKKDHKKLLAYFKAELQSVKQGKSKKRPNTKSKNQSNTISEQPLRQPQEKSKSKSKHPKGKKGQKQVSKPKTNNNALSKPKESAMSKPKSKTGERKSQSKGKIEEKKEPLKREASRRGLRSQSVLTDQVDKVTQAEERPKKMLKNLKKQKKEAPKKFITEAQNKIYKELMQEYGKMTIPQIKEILAKNNQAKTGTKQELIARCADGKQFGRIPNCHKCGGGKLRFNRQTGKYNCPGYMEDTDFINCSGKFNFEEIKRLEWNE